MSTWQIYVLQLVACTGLLISFTTLYCLGGEKQLSIKWLFINYLAFMCGLGFWAWIMGLF